MEVTATTTTTPSSSVVDVVICIIGGLPTALTREHACRLLQPFSFHLRGVSVVVASNGNRNGTMYLHHHRGHPRGYRLVDDEYLQGCVACEMGSHAAAQRVRDALHGRLFLGRRLSVTMNLLRHCHGSSPPPYNVATAAAADGNSSSNSKRGLVVANANRENAEIGGAIRRKVDASGRWASPRGIDVSSYV